MEARCTYLQNYSETGEKDLRCPLEEKTTFAHPRSGEKGAFLGKDPGVSYTCEQF